jgi:hypothetical protein
MWVTGQEQIRKYILGAEARPVGNILLYDKAPNLLSVISVIRWMFKGKKDRYLKIIPPAGVSQVDIKNAARYGRIINESLKKNDFWDLQANLIATGAVDVKTGLIMIEKRGIILFRLWADYILKKGPYGSPSRIFRIRFFKYYLLAVLYLVSPLATILYEIIRPFRRKAIKKQKSLYQLN